MPELLVILIFAFGIWGRISEKLKKAQTASAPQAERPHPARPTAVPVQPKAPPRPSISATVPPVVARMEGGSLEGQAYPARPTPAAPSHPVSQPSRPPAMRLDFTPNQMLGAIVWQEILSRPKSSRLRYRGKV